MRNTQFSDMCILDYNLETKWPKNTLLEVISSFNLSLRKLNKS